MKVVYVRAHVCVYAYLYACMYVECLYFVCSCKLIKYIVSGYKHLSVNHKYNFVDPDTGAYTQNIERTWRTARANIPNYGRRKKNMSGYIAELMFRWKFNDHRDRLHAFFATLGEFHDVLINE